MSGLDAMRAYPQWINYRLSPRPDGKMDKIPIDPRTGRDCDAHSPAVWCDCATAAAAGPLGFVFTREDPFFFLDIDDCRGPEGWNETALYLCGLFPGCAVEVSQSGNGLHIFGYIPFGKPHKSRNKAYGLEFYTHSRFCAITDTGTTGDASTLADMTIYQQFIDYFFPVTVLPDGVDPMAQSSGGWTAEPVPDWIGPEDDAELLARMLKSRSAKSIVGTGVTVKDLWNADSDKLGEVYPDTAGAQGRPFDWSLADAALCSHLSFWTGKNCERIDRLWGQSELGKREKYHDRPEYRRTTIVNAVAMCRKVYRDPKIAREPADPTAPPDDGGIQMGWQFLTPEDQLEYFSGCVYVRDIHRVWVPDGALLNPDQFKAHYGGREFAMDSINDKKSKNAWDVFSQSQAIRFPWAHGVCFRPECESGAVVTEEGRKLVNIYVPIVTPISEGDPGPFLDLVCRLLPVPGDRDILLAYMAACVQYPGVKFQWAPVLQGTFGNGKSKITEILSFCVGHRYTHKVNPKDIDNIFNAWLEGKLLVIVDEVKTSGGDTVETLKWMVTDSRVPIQGKGRDQTTGDNRANLILCTNHTDGIVKTRSDRRFCVFFTAQQSVDDMARDGMLGAYFPAFVRWLNDGGYAIVNGYLRAYSIPAELNPAGACVRAPETSTTEQAIAESYGTLAQEIIEAIECETPGFCGGWLSSISVTRIMELKGIRMSPKRKGGAIEELGYIKHPGLYQGRATCVIPAEVGRPVLYVRRDHPTINITDTAAVVRSFCESQTYPIPDSLPAVTGAVVPMR